MKLNFCFIFRSGTFTIFSLHNKWTGNLHKYNDDTELLNNCETLLINSKLCRSDRARLLIIFSILSTTLMYAWPARCTVMLALTNKLNTEYKLGRPTVTQCHCITYITHQYPDIIWSDGVISCSTTHHQRNTLSLTLITHLHSSSLIKRFHYDCFNSHCPPPCRCIPPPTHHALFAALL